MLTGREGDVLLKNCYRKLGVRRAADAITRAAELALLASPNDQKEGA